MKLFFTILAIQISLAAGAATLERREMFIGSLSNPGHLASTNTGGFDEVPGFIQRVPGGASQPGSPGWSGLMDGSGDPRGVWTSMSSTGYVCGYFRFHSYGIIPSGAPSTEAVVMELSSTAGGPILMRIDGTGRLTVKAFGYGEANHPVMQPEREKWYLLGMSWESTRSMRNIRVWTGVPGGPLTNALSITNALAYGPMTAVKVGCTTNEPSSAGRTIHWRGRISGVSLYATTNSLEAFFPPDITPPSNSSALSWHINPADGDDLASGATPETAWRSYNMLQRALECGIVMGSPTPWVWSSNRAPVDLNSTPDESFALKVRSGTITNGGDTVLLDTSKAPLVITNKIFLTDVHSGIRLKGANGYGVLEPTLPITNWTQVTANIYSTVLPETGVVLWEDLRWYHSPLGATFNAVSNNLASTPGSFWQDGLTGTMYVHPFGSTDPRTDNKTYRRSQRFDTTAPDAIVLSGDAEVVVDGIKCFGVTLRDSQKGDVGVRYVLRTQYAGSYYKEREIRQVIMNCRFGGGCNHAYGNVRTTQGKYCQVVLDSVFEQGPPWEDNPNGYSTIVDYAGTNDDNARRVIYVGSDWSNESLIGLANGGTNAGTWLTHGGASGIFTSILFTNCTGTIHANSAVKDGGLRIIGGNHAALELYDQGMPTIEACFMETGVAGLRGGKVRHSVLACKNAGLGRVETLIGDWEFLNCTILGANKPSTNQGLGLVYWHRAGILTLTNCVLSTSNGNVVFQLSSDSTVKSDFNFWMPTQGGILRSAPPASRLVSLEEWRALSGMDLNSREGDPLVEPLGSLLPQSPARAFGFDIGRALDMTRHWYIRRRTAGAYEYRASCEAVPAFWLYQFGLPLDGSSDHLDEDHDGMPAWQEYVAGTNPTNSSSVLRMLAPVVTPSGVIVRWESTAGTQYLVERSIPGGDGSFQPVFSSTANSNGISAFTDTQLQTSAALYRVRVSK